MRLMKPPRQEKKVPKDDQRWIQTSVAEDSGGSFWEPAKDIPPEPLVPRPRQGSNFGADLLIRSASTTNTTFETSFDPFFVSVCYESQPVG